MITALHKSSQLSTGCWAYVIVLCWVLLAGGALIPAWLWFNVHNLHVFDSVVGQAPRMEVGREVNLPFRARKTVSVQRVDDHGGATTYCASTATNDYRPENALPVSVDLNTWTWPVRCELPAGRYRLNTLWTIDVPFLPKKDVRVMSNVFVVKDP